MYRLSFDLAGHLKVRNMELVLVVFFLTCRLSVSCGQTTGIDNSNITENSFVQRTTKEFNGYCPYMEKCAIDTNKEKNKSEDESCCRHCNCMDKCGLTCCPDKLFTFTNEKEFYDAQKLIRCVDPQYSPPGHDRPDVKLVYSFEMISNCPFNYADGSTVKKCEQEYHDFDFQMPLRNFLPAFDRTEKRVYKNIFCATCHNADINDLDFALLTYNCDHEPSNLTYLHDLAWIVSSADGNCNFRFFPKEFDEWANENCDNRYINRCNVTKMWERYDRELEEECLYYNSECLEHDSVVYKNMACYLCNGFSEHDIITNSQKTNNRNDILDIIFLHPGHFSPGAFKTSVIRKTTDTYDKGCNLYQNEAIYNASQVQTWNLECPFGMVLSGYTCFPPLLQNLDCPSKKSFSDYTCFPPSFLRQKGHIVSMYVSLQLEPDHSQQSQHEISLFTFLSLISTEVQNIFSGLVTKDLFLDYHITFPIDLKVVQTSNMTIDFGSINEIPIHIKVTLGRIKDVILPILDFSLQFNDVARMGDFKTKIRRQNPLILDNVKRPCFPHDNLPRNALYCPGSNSDAINYIRISGTKNNNHIRPEVEIDVEREPFCPRIALEKLAFVESTDPCGDIQILPQILTDEFISKQLSENETHICFCYKDYLQHLKELEMKDVTHATGRNAKELAFIYLTIVCLSASVLSLLTTIIFYAVFPVLRTLPGLNIMALSVTLLVYHFLSVVSTITFVNIPWLCRLIGIFTHFSMIQSFCWMFICTYHMMKVFVKIRNKTVPQNISRTFIIYVICATSVATTLVAITIIVAEVKSGGQDIGYGGKYCYMKDPVMITCVAAIPVALVVILNFCMFCMVLFKISRRPSLAASKRKERQNIVIFIKLSTLTGLSTIFVFLFIFTKLYAFAYLYVVFNCGQGVFIMISFIFNRRVRALVQGLTSEGSGTGSSIVKTSSSKL